jgi:hypothetical protein
VIDPKLLTNENGFVEGCVVEIVQDGRSLLSYWKSQNEPEILMLDVGHIEIMFCEIEKICPLTGPMAIWNFAPEWN